MLFRSSADLPSIAKLHAASWRAAYRGIFSDEFLDGDLEADRMQSWMGVVDRLAPKDRLLIATHDMMGALGFVSGWTSREMTFPPVSALELGQVFGRAYLSLQAMRS